MLPSSELARAGVVSLSLIGSCGLLLLAPTEPAAAQEKSLAEVEAELRANYLKWRTFENVDKLDGGREIGAIKPASATSHTPPRMPTKTDIVGFMRISCRAGKMKIYTGLSDTLIAGPLATISYRFDETKPVSGARWSRSSDNTSVGYWNSAQAPRLAAEVAKSKKLFVRVRDEIFGLSEIEFDFDGAADALGPVRAACKW